MSIFNNQCYQDWEDVLSEMRRKPFVMRGMILDEKSKVVGSEVIWFWATLISDILPDSPSRQVRHLKQWCLAVYSSFEEHIGFAKLVLMKLRLIDTPMTLKSFKRSLRDETVDYRRMCEFIAPWGDLLSQFLQSPNGVSFRKLNWILSFPLRTTLDVPNLEAEALEAYLAIEDHLARAYDTELVRSLNMIMREWLAEFRWSPLLPKHGPGGVSERGRCSKATKYALLHQSERINYLLRRTQTEVACVLPDSAQEIRETVPARVVFVPKGIDSRRTICMEPAVHQYFQQAVLAQLDDYFLTTPLRRVIDLHDQERNAALAKRGSEVGDFATVDLSAASDTVSWELVKRVFRGTAILPGLWCTRSLYTSLPDGTLLRSKKFAPMGSANCFPVECLVFAAACEHAVRINSGPRRRNYVVYGDDIVIRTEYVETLYDILDHLGFVVNRTKSYDHGPFRESCGKEYYQGIDVSPIRIPRKFQGCDVTYRDVGRVQGLVELANTAMSYGAYTMRRYIVSNLLSLPQRFQPLFTYPWGNSSRVWSLQPTNFHKKKRVSRFRFYSQASSLVCLTRYDEYPVEIDLIVNKHGSKFEDYRYFDWWLQFGETDTDVLLPRVARVEKGVKMISSRYLDI